MIDKLYIGKITFSIDIRCDNDDLRVLLVKLISSIINDVTKERHLEYHIIKNMDVSTVHCSNDLINDLRESVSKVIDKIIHNEDDDIVLLSSGAGHDAVAMAEITDVGMLFIRDNGYSHSPKEHVEPLDLFFGILTLIQFLNDKYHLDVMENMDYVCNIINSETVHIDTEHLSF